MVKQQFGQLAYNNLMQNLIFTQQMQLATHHIYGNTRLGIKHTDTTLYMRNITINGFDTLGNVLVNDVLDSLQLQIDTVHYQHALATKQYELTNHLGNVLATVLDRKTQNQADVVSAQHYYPYHSTMQTWEADGKEYTFGGANGQEKDNEIFKGAYTAEFWEYDSRLGRRWNRDPVVKPWQSDYSCLSGSPIWRMDPNGDDDFFNAYGQYLFSTKTGTKIQVITSDGTHRLSSLNPSIYNTTISNIATYYGTLVGVSGSIGLRTYEGSIAHTTTATNQVFISTSKRTGSIDMKLDDYTFMKTVLFHEKLHQEEKKLYDPNEKYTYYKHYLVYSKQFQDEETFGKVSDKADQRSLVNNAVNYLIKSQKENDGAMIGQDIDNLNFTLSKYDIKVNLDPEDLSKFTITQDGKTYNGIVKDIKDGPTN